MKTLNLNEMEKVKATGPCGAEVSCFVASTVIGIFNPVAGFLAGAACLWMPCY